MDNRNKSIPVNEVTSFDVNKAIQRSLTKAAARHGLGLYIYAGEDLPEAVANDTLNDALVAVRASVSVAELTAVWNNYATLKGNKSFVDAVKARGEELRKEDAA